MNMILGMIEFNADYVCAAGPSIQRPCVDFVFDLEIRCVGEIKLYLSTSRMYEEADRIKPYEEEQGGKPLPLIRHKQKRPMDRFDAS